jgi:iron-sulfur cluster repair protein YtfE (RIC family)
MALVQTLATVHQSLWSIYKNTYNRDKAMKRHESIVPLSRDHHTGLLFCWKIRQGLKKQIPPARIQPYVQYFWDNHLKQHFEEEENILFAALKDSKCQQAVAEHKEIRKLIDANTNTADSLNALADSIDNHIRFEERVLFPHIEQVLPAEQLAAIGNQLHTLHENHLSDLYPDEFWV